MNQALDKLDLVFHLASAHLSVRVSDRECREVNVKAAENLVRMSQMAGVKTFVACSTVGIDGILTEVPGNENSPANPDLVYEKTKRAGEQAMLRVSEEAASYPITIRSSSLGLRARLYPHTQLFRAIRADAVLLGQD